MVRLPDLIWSRTGAGQAEHRALPERVATDRHAVLQCLAGDVYFACAKPLGSLKCLDLAIPIAVLLALVNS